MPTFPICLLILLSLLADAAAQEGPAGAVAAEPDRTAPFGSATSVQQLKGGDLLVALPSGQICVIDVESGATISDYRTADSWAPGTSGVSCWLAPDQRHLALGPIGGPLEIRAFEETSIGQPETALEVEPKRTVEVVIETATEAVVEGSTGWTEACWTPGGGHLVTWRRDWFHGPPERFINVWALDGTLAWRGPLASDVAVHPTIDQVAIVETNRVTIGWPDSGFRGVDIPGAHGTIAYSPDGSQIAVGGTSKQIDLDEDRPWRRPGGGRLATITILDASSCEIRSRTQPDGWPHQWLQRISWSPTGEHLGFSAGKGYSGGTVRAADMKTIHTFFAGGQMWAILEGFWVNERFYRPYLFMDYRPGDRSLVLDIKDPAARTMTPQKDWRGVTRLTGTEDVIVRHAEGIARVTPSTMKVQWER
ncbi:hypothetical protein Poly30_52140 [Planctomycetes bacterium Poly30]|uniref:WD40-like Beta Propeller Repeat protein n=1 Tax=Saltatorellus ferox TaxID=2528018 RepID=A0A518EZZ4_9BACT|nr:hypothetical protein Poly30_52140 [Planctomycetes bacterium Poly30]